MSKTLLTSFTSAFHFFRALCACFGSGGAEVLQGITYKSKLGWSCYATTLRLLIGKTASAEQADHVGFNASETMKRRLLAAALGSMKRIRTVIHSEWKRKAIFDSLNVFRSLEAVQLEVRGSVNLDLAQLPALHCLKINTSSWQQSWEMLPNVSNAVAQSRNLTTLQLFGGSQWNINANIVTNDLLEYLGSYSGIEKLPEATDRQADFFFATVLLQAASLPELSCPPEYESCWRFGIHSVETVVHPHKLKNLTMSVNAVDVLGVDPAMNAVVRTIALLPTFRTVDICSANSERNRRSQFWNERQCHAVVQSGIMVVIENFSFHPVSWATVTAGNNTYELRPGGQKEIAGVHTLLRPDILLEYGSVGLQVPGRYCVIV
ncbi:hypothetical protein C8R43DRAFT_957121 [Mycena crocata]|nr:hypothetical protein C8R43DRAFT_957121 [Mycena crocata]